MIDGPHIFGFSPDALCINLTSALASARLVSSVMASMNAATLTSVGLVLFSAIVIPSVSPQGSDRLMREHSRKRSASQPILVPNRNVSAPCQITSARSEEHTSELQ